MICCLLASTKKPVAKATSFSTANGENEDRSEEWSEPEEFKQSDSEEIVRTNLWKVRDKFERSNSLAVVECI